MPLIIKVAVQAAHRHEQHRLDGEIEAAGIVRILSTIPPYYLTNAEDLDLLTTIAAAYRTKPAVAAVSEDDVPPEPEIAQPTEELVAFIHRAGYLFVWDDDTQLWCVAGIRDGFPDQSEDTWAPEQRAAVVEAIRYLVE